MAIIKGKLLMVSIDTNSGGCPQTIAYATSHTLELSADTDSVATKDDNELYENKEVVSQSWSMTTENLICADPSDVGKPTYSDLKEAMTNQNRVELEFSYVSGSAGAARPDDKQDWLYTGGAERTRICHGYAYITSLEVNAENKSNVTYSATFSGSGSITLS